MDAGSDLSTLIRALNEAACWLLRPGISDVVDPGRFRSPELFPMSGFLDVSPQERNARVRAVVDARSRRVPPQESIVTSEVRSGRLVVMEPEQSLFDGAAEVHSKGFFDSENVPGWDTWVGMLSDDREATGSFRDCLVSWVPRFALRKVRAGIDANPEACIAWVSDVTSRALDPLRHLGLA